MGFELDSAGEISNRAIRILVSSFQGAAFEVSLCEVPIEFERPITVGKRTSRVFLEPFGMSAIGVRNRILGIELDRMPEIGDGSIKVPFLLFFAPPNNKAHFLGALKVRLPPGFIPRSLPGFGAVFVSDG